MCQEEKKGRRPIFPSFLLRLSCWEEAKVPLPPRFPGQSRGLTGLSHRSAGFVPICSLGLSQIGRMNLGMDASTFKFYTMCGLQEGFEPFAVNMNRDVAMWFSKRLPTFVNVPKDHPQIEVMLHVAGTLAGRGDQGPELPLRLLCPGGACLSPHPGCPYPGHLLAGPQSCRCRYLSWGS